MRRSERGSAVIEFALVLPIVLVVLLALVQVAVLARDRLVLTEAARAGARAAAVEASDDAAAAAARAAAAGLDPDRLVVHVARTGERGSAVTVSVSYEVAIVAPLAGWLFPSSVGLGAEATMRQEFG